ncbi:MAG: hypothetical protein QOI71_1554 [Gaiellales bacterium]|jgi:hypothetical protein|nr:hypothetical protein [Gaiellales bacterium]
MKILLILATLGLATFVVLRRRSPELADRVQNAVTDAAKDAADSVKDNPLESAGDIASGLRDKAKGIVG